MSIKTAFENIVDEMDLDENISINDKKSVKEGITEHTSSNIHDDDIKEDYEEVRNSIKQNNQLISGVLDRVVESIDNCEDQKYLARRVEALSQLLRTQMDLQKELFVLHKNKQGLLKDDTEENKGKNDSSLNKVLDAMGVINKNDIW